MPKYVDGFVVPVPKSKLVAYKKLAKVMAKVWKEHGALDYVECIGDDVKKGKSTSFPQSVKLKADEVVVFSWITYKSRAHRDRVVDKALNDPRLDIDLKAMPFDGKRVVFGGFKQFMGK